MRLCRYIAQNGENHTSEYTFLKFVETETFSPRSSQEAPGTEAAAQRSEAHNIAAAAAFVLSWSCLENCLSRVDLPGESPWGEHGAAESPWGEHGAGERDSVEPNYNRHGEKERPPHSTLKSDFLLELAMWGAVAHMAVFSHAP